jgi:hypothetical protein
MEKKKIHLSINFLLYVFCQFLGWRILGRADTSILIQLIMVFLYSFMMTAFYRDNKNIIMAHYEGSEYY